MNRREALAHLAAGGKVRSDLMPEKSFVFMNDLGQVLLQVPGHKPTVEILPDVEYEEFVETEEVGVIAYISRAALLRLCEDDFSTTLQVRSEANQLSNFPVRISWDQEVGVDNEQEVPGQEIQH